MIQWRQLVKTESGAALNRLIESGGRRIRIEAEPLGSLIGELSTRSDDFRTRWGAHNVRLHRTGLKTLHHSAVGQLDLTFDGLELAADPGLTLYVMTADPNSTTAERLKLLGSWAATQREQAAETTAE